MIHEISNTLSLPTTSKDPQAWSKKEESWEVTMKRIVSRYNRACFKIDDFDDIKTEREGNHQLPFDESVIRNIFEVDFSSALDALRTTWNLTNINLD